MENKPTTYWTFFCNPNKWEIDKFLSTNIEYDTYRVNDWYRNETMPGQLGIIRVGLDKRNKKTLQGRQKLRAGIYAIVEVISFPEITNEVSGFYIDEKENGQEKLRVKIRYLKNLLNKPLLLDDLKNNEKINADKFLIEGFQRSSMPLKEITFNEIINLIEDGENVLSNIEKEEAETEIQIRKLELKYLNASPKVKLKISKYIERGKIATEFKKLTNYKCQVCEALNINPYSFRKKDGSFYVETHHINHVSKLETGSLSINNLITVCANHHRQFHYGDITILENTNELLNIEIDSVNLTIKKVGLASA